MISEPVCSKRTIWELDSQIVRKQQGRQLQESWRPSFYSEVFSYPTLLFY